MKHPIQRLAAGFFRWYYLIFFGVIGGILLFVDKHISYFARSQTLLPNLVLLPLGLLFAGLLFALTRRAEKPLGRFKPQNVLRVCAVILLVLQIVLVHCIWFRCGWDVSCVQSSVESMLAGEGYDYHYFKLCPNNVFLYGILLFTARAATAFHLPYYAAELGLTLAVINLALYLAARLVLEKTGRLSDALFAHILGGLLVGLSPWASVPYTDEISMVFPILTLYIYEKIRGKNLPVGVKIFAVSIVPVYGYFVKPHTFIVLIAIALTELCRLEKSFFVPQKLLQAAAAFAAVLVCGVAIRHFGYGYVYFEPNANTAYGPMHFLMMGLNDETNGAYSATDTGISNDYTTKESRDAANLEVIEQRLQEYGFSGLVLHSVKKALVNFNDGTFAWGVDGNFYSEIPEEESDFAQFLRSFYYEGGEHEALWRTWAQMLWLAVFGLAYAAVFSRRRMEDPLLSAATLALTGICMFNMLFEARARFVLCYSPVFVLCAVLAAGWIWEKRENKLFDF